MFSVLFYIYITEGNKIILVFCLALEEGRDYYVR